MTKYATAVCSLDTTWLMSNEDVVCTKSWGNFQSSAARKTYLLGEMAWDLQIEILHIDMPQSYNFKHIHREDCKISRHLKLYLPKR